MKVGWTPRNLVSNTVKWEQPESSPTAWLVINYVQQIYQDLSLRALIDYFFLAVDYSLLPTEINMQACLTWSRMFMEKSGKISISERALGWHESKWFIAQIMQYEAVKWNCFLITFCSFLSFVLSFLHIFTYLCFFENRPLQVF